MTDPEKLNNPEDSQQETPGQKAVSEQLKQLAGSSDKEKQESHQEDWSSYETASANYEKERRAKMSPEELAKDDKKTAEENKLYARSQELLAQEPKGKIDEFTVAQLKKITSHNFPESVKRDGVVMVMRDREELKKDEAEAQKILEHDSQEVEKSKEAHNKSLEDLRKAQEKMANFQKKAPEILRMAMEGKIDEETFNKMMNELSSEAGKEDQEAEARVANAVAEAEKKDKEDPVISSKWAKAAKNFFMGAGIAAGLVPIGVAVGAAEAGKFLYSAVSSETAKKVAKKGAKGLGYAVLGSVIGIGALVKLTYKILAGLYDASRAKSFSGGYQAMAKRLSMGGNKKEK